MKSRIHIFRIKKCVIFSTSSDTEYETVKELCEISKIPLYIVFEKQYDKTIKEISESQPSLYDYESNCEDSDLNTQFLVLCGFDGNGINRFLNHLSSKNINIPLKCTATEYNVNMKLYECIECIRKEHNELHNQ